jgi:predicted permease
MLATLWQDLRHGGRMLVKNPGFALIAIASIGIGVGANAAMFSLADGLLLRPLGIPRPGEVLSIVGTSPERGLFPPGLSYPDYVDIRERARTFASLAAFRNVLAGFDARPDQPALRTIGSAVNGRFFEALEIRPATGRFFRPDEDVVPGRDAVVVLDHRTWRDRFGLDPSIVGRTVRITDTQFTVIGVAPESFKGLDFDVWPAFYVPLAMLGELQNPLSTELTRRNVRELDVKGRLGPGVTLAQAQQEIARIGGDLAKEHPDTNRTLGLAVRTELELRMAGPDAMLVMMLMALAIAVLLAACANVAGLLTSRAPTRARELALRLSVGAGRVRLVRQLMTESLIVACAGAAVGLSIAYGAVVLFRRIEFPTEVPLKLFFELDRRVLTIGLIVAGASTLLSSLIPAWQASRTNVIALIKGSPDSAAKGRQWGRHALVCLQVALSLVLLSVTAALYAGFGERLLKGPGYRTEGLLLMRFDPRLAGYSPDRARQFYSILKQRAQALPAVTSIGLTSMVPLKIDTLERQRVSPEGIRLADDAPDVAVAWSRVDEGFFSTLSIPVLAGRPFTAADREDAPNVAIVNQAFAERYWPGQSSVGKRVRVRPFDGRGDGWFEIVGVVANTKLAWLGEDDQDILYVPYRQRSAMEHTLVVATRGNPENLVAPLREIARTLDPDVPVFGVRTMDDLYQSRGIKVPQMIVRTTGGMGAMGLLLTFAGLYGLVAHAVNRRTREIGIRVAVGASPSLVVAMVLRRGLVSTLTGLALGAAASIAAARATEAAVPGLGGFGPSIYAVVVPVLFAVTLIAAYIPARRAAHIDPLQALRTE